MRCVPRQALSALPPTLGGCPVHQEERPLVNPHGWPSHHVTTSGALAARTARRLASATGRVVRSHHGRRTLLPPQQAGVLLTRGSGYLSTCVVDPATTSQSLGSWPPRQLGDLLLQQDTRRATHTAGVASALLPPRLTGALPTRRSGPLSTRTIGPATTLRLGSPGRPGSWATYFCTRTCSAPTRRSGYLSTRTMGTATTS